MVKIDLRFVQGLTLEERAALVSGKDFWFTAKVPEVDRMMMSDGPSGLRKQDIDVAPTDINNSVDAVCFPSSALTASSFDDQMLFELGQHLGVAANAERLGVLLGPGVNIKRSPLAGRNFEYFSEDPLLAGRMGTAYVKGVQEEDVGVSVKHFAANNRENQRFTSSSNIDERALREIYLAQVSLANSSPAWRQILVVSDKNPISFPAPGYIVREETVDGITTRTTYFTTGSIFRHIEQDGMHYYWFIVERVETTQSADPEALKEQMAINDILTGGDGTNGEDSGGSESV